MAPSLIPASALFYATPISGSPFNTTVVPRGNGIPYTGVHGEELPPMPGEEDSGDTVNEEVRSACYLEWTCTSYDRF